MIKLNNLSKVFQSKRRNKKAVLKSINVSFPSTGIIFILGKSGSGKTTLLNIIGGLDTPADGEIYFDETKLNEEFLDEYRKNIVAFIFQNYNLLDDFNVKENIELGVSVRKKEETISIIRKSLKEVELEGFENRKINELSGGQKQRVAIARALAKESLIILADEPTGALDSETSSTIFSLLKKISKEKLVIIASHDSDAAFKYGDRILRIKDGEICEDIILNETKKNKQNNYYFKKIKGFSKVFSKNLTFSTINKLAFNSLKIRWFRLALTIILSLISFNSFTIASSCLFFNSGNVLKSEIENRNFDYVTINKKINTRRPNSEAAGFNNSDIFLLKEYGINAKLLIDKLPGYDNEISFDNSLIEQVHNINYSSFYSSKPSGFIYESPKVIEDILNYEIIGSYPVSDYEIAITEYFYNLFNTFGVYLYDEDSNLLIFNKNELEENDLINKYIEIGDHKYKVAGLLKSNVEFNDDDFKYYPLINEKTLESEEAIIELTNLNNEFSIEYLEGYPSAIFVSENYYSQIANPIINLSSVYPYSIMFKINDDYISNLKKQNSWKNILFFEKGKTQIRENELVLSSSYLSNLIEEKLHGKDLSSMNFENSDLTDYQYSIELNISTNEYEVIKKSFQIAQPIEVLKREKYEVIFEYCVENYPKRNTLFNNLLNSYYLNNYSLSREEISNDLAALFYFMTIINDDFFKEIDINNNEKEQIEVLRRINKNEYKNIFGGYSLAYFNDLHLISTFYKYFDEEFLNQPIVYYANRYREDEFSIVGIYIEKEKDNLSAYISEDLFDLYEENNVIGYYDSAIFPYDSLNNVNIEGLYKDFYNGKDYDSYRLLFDIRNSTNDYVSRLNDTFSSLFPIFLSIACILGAFSVLLFANFISLSILNRNKEIGVLRSLGSKNSDIFLIFFVETLFILLFVIACTIISSSLVLLFINNYLITGTPILSSIIGISWSEIIVMFILGFITLLITSIVPINHLLKNKIINIVEDK